MHKNLTIRKKLYSLALIVGIIFISVQVVFFILSKNVKQNWDDYNGNVEIKMNLISKINNDFGYGGAIHNFKNYLIRGNKIYFDEFNENYKSFMRHKDKYLNLESVSELEVQSLEIISGTFFTYSHYLNLVESLIQKGKSIKYIDSIIKVDDSAAFIAMKELQNSFVLTRDDTTTKIHNSIYMIYYLAIFVIFCIIIANIFIGKFFENTVIKPLIEIEVGLISFFKYMSNKKHTIKPIVLSTNDEFGIMARSLNKNIVLAKNLHHDVTVKNDELNTMIFSYGQNVIASNTDLEGIITYVSEAFVKISGYSKEELVGQPHSIVRHPDSPRVIFSQMWKTIKKGEVWEGEVKNRTKKGEYYLVKATVSPIYDEEKRHIGYSAIREDITDHKQVEILNEQLDVYKKHLEAKVKKATTQIEDLIVEIEDTQKEVVFTMGAIGERRSEETGNHVRRVAEYSKLFALYCGLNEKEAEMLKQSSPMHDIGKVGISDAILNKKGKLTSEEFSMMQEHAVLGFNMLKSSTRPLLKMASIVAHEHHEKYDGTGYPQGLKKDEIHIYGRITAVADVFDALGSTRCYKEAWDDEKIFDLFKKERGYHFDPDIIDIFFDHLDEFLSIRNKFRD